MDGSTTFFYKKNLAIFHCKKRLYKLKMKKKWIYEGGFSIVKSEKEKKKEVKKKSQISILFDF
jgi:hypothetical protein